MTGCFVCCSYAESLIRASEVHSAVSKFTAEHGESNIINFSPHETLVLLWGKVRLKYESDSLFRKSTIVDVELEKRSLPHSALCDKQ